jgi:hypothetical protein
LYHRYIAARIQDRLFSVSSSIKNKNRNLISATENGISIYLLKLMTIETSNKVMKEDFDILFCQENRNKVISSLFVCKNSGRRSFSMLSNTHVVAELLSSSLVSS